MSDLERPTGSDDTTPATVPSYVPRTAAATAGRMRASEERQAAKLEARGWVCLPPEVAEAGRALLRAREAQTAEGVQ